MLLTFGSLLLHTLNWGKEKKKADKKVLGQIKQTFCSTHHEAIKNVNHLIYQMLINKHTENINCDSVLF